MTTSDFAVIVPAFNEAPVIKDLVQELRKAFERHGLDGEVVLVDDGSTDDTASLARQEADGWEAFKVVLELHGSSAQILFGPAGLDPKLTKTLQQAWQKGLKSAFYRDRTKKITGIGMVERRYGHIGLHGLAPHYGF